MPPSGVDYASEFLNGYAPEYVQQVSNACDLTPAWFQKGVEAALLAPTAINQQKFSFEYILKFAA